MDRRTFLLTAVAGTVVAGSARIAGATSYFPTPVDPMLFEGINRVKDPAKKSPLETSHAPVITAPLTVKAGEPFSVVVSVGERLHDMGPTHWIEYVELQLGNEPAGRVDFQPKGYLKPKVEFTVVIPKETAAAGKLTLMVHQRCNLHGLWEGSLDLVVT